LAVAGARIGDVKKTFYRLPANPPDDILFTFELAQIVVGVLSVCYCCQSCPQHPANFRQLQFKLNLIYGWNQIEISYGRRFKSIWQKQGDFT